MSVQKERSKVHEPTTCECSVFEVEGEAYLHLDTFGSAARQERGKLSKSIQLDARAVKQLRAILDKAFPITDR